jgi:ribosomal-protein-alanine N-acetyltransferase
MPAVPPGEIVTERLRIAPATANDAIELAQWLEDPAVAEPFHAGGIGFGGGSRAAVQASWIQATDDWSRRLVMRLAARARADGALVGGLQLAQGNLSYLVKASLWRQGYGKEMVRACCERALGEWQCRDLRARVLRENLASRHVLEACGFVFVGLAPLPRHGRSGSVTVLDYQWRAQRSRDRSP